MILFIYKAFINVVAFYFDFLSKEWHFKELPAG